MGSKGNGSLHIMLASHKGLGEKTVLSKKEKMKLRKERWLQKIESVKLAKQKQKAEAKRKATPVVGDMQPLMEALPELSDLTTGSRGRKPSKRMLHGRGCVAHVEAFGGLLRISSLTSSEKCCKALVSRKPSGPVAQLPWMRISGLASTICSRHSGATSEQRQNQQTSV
ncbi:protein FAM207A isoform X2 [Egretta garzetta]|uniref:protein FAM207A isoform X2 n=1 Tax=Egretta garzetta TaxID=188379 RepID=UPI00163C621A|nr:protein FAM207A isoform X2 [Egretta garzetta]